MRVDFSVVPKGVYYVLIPIFILIIICILYWMVTKNKSDEKYHVFNLNYVFHMSGVLVCTILFSLLAGYAIAMFKTLIAYNILADYYFFIIVISFLPIIPLITFIWLIKKIRENFEYKKELDNEKELEVQSEV